MEANEVFNQLWVEKYRPKKLSDVVLTEEQNVFFEKCIQKQDIPHMLFYGPPGSGKTTTARIFVSNLIKSNMDILSINGSDTNGVDYIRNIVVEFCKTPPMSSKFKIVFIDEADYLTTNGQAILRNAMETYAKNARFIFTCNYIHKIIAPISESRCTQFEMKKMPEDFVKKLCIKILSKENISYDENDIDLIVKGLLPDVRRIINTLQKNSIDGKLRKVKREDLITCENKIVGMIVELCDSVGTTNVQSTCNKVFPTIMDMLQNEKGLEINKVYDMIFNHEKIPSWAKIKINEYSNRHLNCFNGGYNFMALCYDIIQTGLQYVKMFGIRK